MRVWMNPKYNSTNKYNNLFSESIIKYGLEVCNFRWRNFIHTKKNDIVHLHWIHGIYQSNFRSIFIIRSIIAILIFLSLKSKGTKIVWTLHNIYPHKYKFIKLERTIRKILLLLCNKIFVGSESIKQQAINEFGLKNSNHFEVIPLGHYKGVYTARGINYRSSINIEESKFVYLFIGAIKPYKGIKELVENFNIMNDPDCVLVIAGKPSDGMEQVLKSLHYNDNIKTEFRFIPDDEIADMIISADVIVLPFKEITTTSTAILALSFKKPIVAPKTGYLSEYFTEDTSILYEEESNLLEAMYKAKEKFNSSNLSDEAFEDKLSTIGWEDIAGKVCAIYKGLISK